MVYGIGEITYEELSPELQARIASGSGGTVAGLMVIDGVFTKKVVATAEEQTEFEIPFDDYDSLNSHLDIKINSTWINPERYEIVGNKIVLNDGVEIGTSVFFTLFSLAEPTGDGGFIEDIEIAETPQEIIVYDGGIIDEKVGAHNVSGEAHSDIREELSRINTEVSNIDTSWTGISGKPEAFPPSTHTHDDRYYTESEINNKCFMMRGYISDDLTGTSNGSYLTNASGVTNLPSGWVQGRHTLANLSVGNEASYDLQLLGGYYEKALAFRMGSNSVWEEIATTSKINNLTLLNGWYTGYDEPIVITKSGKTVCMSGIISNENIISSIISADIPVGFRPAVSRTFMVGSATGVTSERARIYVRTDGTITGHDLEGSTGGLVIVASWEVA